MGREVRTVVVDEARAPLITKAFRLYAEGRHTVKQLAEELAAEGLTTAVTPQIPSRPVNETRINTILVNPYYKGLVTYNKALYEGTHTKLTDAKTWEKVQDILKSHRQGERTRKHPHFLKSTVWCGSCNGRLLVQVSRNSTGDHYRYLMCGNRHAKRNNCQQRSVQIDEVEKQLEQYYSKIHLGETEKKSLKKLLLVELEKRYKEEVSSQGNIRLERDKIARKQKKLLEAHYADAISLDMFKEEQAILQRAMTNIEAKLASLEQNYNSVTSALESVLELAANAGKLYQSAPEHIKRMLNQVFFEKVLVHTHDDVKPERTPVFEALLSAKTKQLVILDELSGQTLTQKMLSYVICLSNVLLVQLSESDSEKYKTPVGYLKGSSW